MYLPEQWGVNPEIQKFACQAVQRVLRVRTPAADPLFARRGLVHERYSDRIDHTTRHNQTADPSMSVHEIGAFTNYCLSLDAILDYSLRTTGKNIYITWTVPSNSPSRRVLKIYRSVSTSP